MAKLSEELQTYIVQAHACFRKPALIVKDVKAEFGVEVTSEQVKFYHPARGKKNKGLGEKWKALFDETRKAFLERLVELGVAHQSWRLELYQRAAEFYEEKGNYVLAAEMAERAAKEVGGFYVSQREITGRGGAPLVPPHISGSILKAYGDAGDRGGEQRLS